MKQKKMMQLLVDDATLAHRSNLGHLGESRRILEGAEQTREMLSEYRSVQQGCGRIVQGNTIEIHELTIRNRFIEKLDLALTQQDCVVLRHEASVLANQSSVSASAIRLRSIERLIKLRTARRAQLLQKTEQRQTDELATHIVFRRNQS
jgi:flagellar export protein FliJ